MRATVPLSGVRDGPAAAQPAAMPTAPEQPVQPLPTPPGRVQVTAGCPELLAAGPWRSPCKGRCRSMWRAALASGPGMLCRPAGPQPWLLLQQKSGLLSLWRDAADTRALRLKGGPCSASSTHAFRKQQARGETLDRCWGWLICGLLFQEATWEIGAANERSQ